MAKAALELPIIDLASSDPTSVANSIRQACMDCGFFYLINHGVDENLLRKVLEGNKAFFALPTEDKMKHLVKEHIGYSPLKAYSRGGSNECFDIGPLEDVASPVCLNQWPSEEALPGWRSTMEDYYKKVLSAGERVVSLIALSLNLDENFFHDVGAFSPPTGFLRLFRYPGEMGTSNEEIFGATAHSDYGMITLVATDGTPGLQVCRDKTKKPRVWEDVKHLPGAFVVNIGDMMERWTNCVFRYSDNCVNFASSNNYRPRTIFNGFLYGSQSRLCDRVLEELLRRVQSSKVSTNPQWRLPQGATESRIQNVSIQISTS